jgi:ligand-binding sensor domain-containing protein
VVGFSAQQLAAGGAQTPPVTIGAVTGSLNAPLALAFDNNGDLWVANANANTVVEYSAAQLVASGNPAPAVTLSAAAGSIVGPSGLAFDSELDLWVANGNTGHNTLVEFLPSQLRSSGAPTPRVVLGATAGSLVSPTGLAFDNSGSLWVSNGNNTVVGFTVNQQLSSGSPAPVVAFTTTSLMSAPIGGIAFDPEQILGGPYDY